MLVDDLGATPPRKQNREVIELFDLALKLDPIDQKHHYIKFVLAQMLQERVLKGFSGLSRHVLVPRKHP